MDTRRVATSAENTAEEYRRLWLSQTEIPFFKDPTAEYDIVRQVGKGTFSTVFYARHSDYPEGVALKLIDKKRVTDTQDVRKVLRNVRRVNNEVNLMRACAHDGICTLLNAFQTNQQVFIIMDFVERDLFHLLSGFQNGLPEKLQRNMNRIVALSVSYLHRLGIAHRDIKPENILVKGSLQNDDLMVKLCDFGLSLRPPAKCADFVGSPGFFAPEILVKKSYDAFKADVWSLGAVMLETLIGTPLFGHLWLRAYGVLDSRAVFAEAIAESIHNVEDLDLSFIGNSGGSSSGGGVHHASSSYSSSYVPSTSTMDRTTATDQPPTTTATEPHSAGTTSSSTATAAPSTEERDSIPAAENPSSGPPSAAALANEEAKANLRVLLVGALKLDPDQRLSIEAIVANKWLEIPKVQGTNLDDDCLRISRLTIDDMPSMIPDNDQNAPLRRDELTTATDSYYDFPTSAADQATSVDQPRSRRSPFPRRFSDETSAEYTLPAMTICHLDDSPFVRRVFEAKLSMAFPCHRLINFAESTSLIHIIMSSQMPPPSRRHGRLGRGSDRRLGAVANPSTTRPSSSGSGASSSRTAPNASGTPGTTTTTNTPAVDQQLSEIRCCIFDEHIREDLKGSDLARMLIRLGYQGLILCMTACDDIVEQHDDVYDDFLSKEITTPELHKRIVTAWKNKFGEAALVPIALLSTRGYRTYDPCDFRDLRGKCILQILRANKAVLRHAELLDIKGDLESVRCPKHVLDVVRRLIDDTDVESETPFGRNSPLYVALEDELIHIRTAVDKSPQNFDTPPLPTHQPRRFSGLPPGHFNRPQPQRMVDLSGGDTRTAALS